MAKKLGPNDPRMLPNGSWYYVNPRSTIEFVAYSDSLGSVVSRLTERDLVEMISQLRPKKKRAATKPRDAKRAVATVGAKRKK